MKSKIVSGSGPVNPPTNGSPSNAQAQSQFTKELPNIQARSIAGGLSQSPQNAQPSSGQPAISNYAGLSAYLQNGKSPKSHMAGGQAVAMAHQIRHSSLRNQLKGMKGNYLRGISDLLLSCLI
jgi:hypothetical protein